MFTTEYRLASADLRMEREVRNLPPRRKVLPELETESTGASSPVVILVDAGNHPEAKPFLKGFTD